MTPITRAIDTFWQNRSDDMRWLESLGDLPCRLMDEVRKENRANASHRAGHASHRVTLRCLGHSVTIDFRKGEE